MKVMQGFDENLDARPRTGKGHDEECQQNLFDWDTRLVWDRGLFHLTVSDSGDLQFEAHGHSVIELMAWAGVQIQQMRWSCQDHCDAPECVHQEERCATCGGLLPWRGSSAERGINGCSCYLPIADALSHFDGRAVVTYQTDQGGSATTVAEFTRGSGAWVRPLRNLTPPHARYAVYHPNGTPMVTIHVTEVCQTCGQTLQHDSPSC